MKHITTGYRKRRGDMREQRRFKRLMALMLCGLFLFAGAFLFCGSAYCEAEEEEEAIQTRENPITNQVRKHGAFREGQKNNEMLKINDGQGLGGDKPSSAIQQTRPSAPVQSLRPSAPAQSMRPKAPAQTMRPKAPAQTMRPSAPDQRVRPSAPNQTFPPAGSVQ